MKISHKHEVVPSVDCPHPLTSDVDFLPPAEMVRLLRQVSLEIFTGQTATLDGQSPFPGLSDPHVAEEVEALGRRMAEVWKARPAEQILLAGGETTGRLATFLATRFNGALKSAGFHPVFLADIAGGPDAFFNFIAGAEFDPEAGADRWYALRERYKIGLVIGLTADLSTPYVCGLLDSALSEAHGSTVLLGFVAPELARIEPALADGRSARDLIRALDRMPNGHVLSIPVGNEPLIGSTRNKCGAATLAVFIAAFLHGLQGRPAAETFGTLQEAAEVLADLDENLAEVAEIGGQVLRKSGRLYYLGRAGAGVLGVIDAAECISTFSDNPLRVRGFCIDGANACGLEALAGHAAFLSPRPRLRAQISAEAFRTTLSETQVGPSVTVATDMQKRRNPLMQDLLRVAVHSGGFARKISVPQVTHADPWLGERAWEFSVRLALQCFSTGAYVLAGKTYGNRLIDIRMNSLALFEQAVQTVVEVSNVSADQARRALLTAIYRGPVDARIANDVPAHLAAAAGRPGLVARAILLGAGFSLEDALTTQSKEPIVRKAMHTLNEARDADSAARESNSA